MAGSRDHSANLHNLALVYERLGDTAKAEHYLRLDLATARYWSEKYPDDRDSHANLAHSLASLAFLLSSYRPLYRRRATV